MRRHTRLEKLSNTLAMLRKAHEARIAALARADAELADRQDALSEALGADQPCHGLFVDVTARRLSRLRLERAALADRIAAAGADLALANRQAGSAERLLARIQAEYAETDERRRLEEIATSRRSGSGKPDLS